MGPFILKEMNKPDRLVRGNMNTKQFRELYKRYYISTGGIGKTFEEYLTGTGYYLVDVEAYEVIDLNELRDAVYAEYQQEVLEYEKDRPGFKDMMNDMNGIKL